MISAKKFRKIHICVWLSISRLNILFYIQWIIYFSWSVKCKVKNVNKTYWVNHITCLKSKYHIHKLENMKTNKNIGTDSIMKTLITKIEFENWIKNQKKNINLMSSFKLMLNLESFVNNIFLFMLQNYILILCIKYHRKRRFKLHGVSTKQSMHVKTLLSCYLIIEHKNFSDF